MVENLDLHGARCSKQTLKLAKLGKLHKETLKDFASYAFKCRTVAYALIRIDRLYRHTYSGKVYSILAVGKDHESKKLVVVYRGVDDRQVWVRELESFLEPVKYGRPKFLELPKR